MFHHHIRTIVGVGLMATAFGFSAIGAANAASAPQYLSCVPAVYSHGSGQMIPGNCPSGPGPAPQYVPQAPCVPAVYSPGSGQMIPGTCPSG